MDAAHLKPRFLAASVERALAALPVVAVVGARQTGKSTLVRSLATRDERLYLTLDDLDVREQARTAPHDLVRRAGHLTLDEIQREPDLLLEIKRAVDEDRRPGRFLLTGSANLLLMQRVAESLAGRASYLTLWPLSRRECLGRGTAGRWSDLFDTPRKDWRRLLSRPDAPGGKWEDLARVGGYPTPALTLDSAGARALWFSGYVQTYLERDLRDLASVDNLPDFRRLMRALALRVGTLLNIAAAGTAVGLPRTTADRWINLLEVSYQLVRVPPFTVNRSKRLIRAPKLYWSDTGLALHLSGDPEPTGFHLENLVLAELLAWRDAGLDPPQVMHWRTAGGEEVDFIVEWRGRLLAVECKASDRPASADARGLRSFLSEYGTDALGGLLLHTGNELSWIAEGVLACPLWRII